MFYFVPAVAVHDALSSTAFSMERCATSGCASFPPPGRKSNVVGSPSSPITADSVTTSPSDALTNPRSITVSPAGISVSNCGESTLLGTETEMSNAESAVFSTTSVPPGYCGPSSEPVGRMPAHPERVTRGRDPPKAVMYLRRRMGGIPVRAGHGYW